MLGAGEATKWEFVCLLPLFDPPRHDTQETIEKCKEKGISVKMVTGDQLLIGKETARQLGMGTDMYSTEVLLSVCFRPSLSLCYCNVLVLSSLPIPITHAYWLNPIGCELAAQGEHDRQGAGRSR